MLKRTEGIVLRNFPIGEADLIVTYLTRDYGLLRVFAKSPRKIKSRFGSSLEPLTYSKIGFIGREDANLPRLTQSDIIKPFHPLREDLKCMINISDTIELGLKLLPERESNPDVFRLLLNILTKLQANNTNRLYLLYFKMKFLQIAGYSPGFDTCGRCGVKMQRGNTMNRNTMNGSAMKRREGALSTHYYFCPPEGSLICLECAETSREAIKVSGSAVLFYESLLKWHLRVLERIRAPENLFSEIDEIIDSHVACIIGSWGLGKKKFLCH